LYIYKCDLIKDVKNINDMDLEPLRNILKDLNVILEKTEEAINKKVADEATILHI